MSYSPLDLVQNYLRRFVAYPSEHAIAAHVLWIAHTHLIDSFDTTPRLAFMSAEKESGKTRALEVTALFVPEPIMSISASPAVIVRRIAQGQCTLLYDEIDGVFGSIKAQEANIDLRSVLNGGYRRGAKVYRCATHGKKIEIEEFDAFAPVAVAGLRELPDTLASRSIIIRMKRRAPDETVEPFRHRLHADQAKQIAEDLADWCSGQHLAGVEPTLPRGIEDRAADCWEPLLAIADAVGGDWPTRARAAAVHHTARAADETLTAGVELLGHVREAFGEDDRLASKVLLERLCELPESPWKDIRGKPLDERGLAKRLKGYGIKPKVVRIGDGTPRGYAVEDLRDAWKRYLPALGELARNKRNIRNNIDNKNNSVADVADVAGGMAKGGEDDAPEPGSTEPDDMGEIPSFLGRRQRKPCAACDDRGCPTCRPEAFGLPWGNP